MKKKILQMVNREWKLWVLDTNTDILMGYIIDNYKARKLLDNPQVIIVETFTEVGEMVQEIRTKKPSKMR
jgi:hypothetical protein